MSDQEVVKFQISRIPLIGHVTKFKIGLRCKAENVIGSLISLRLALELCAEQIKRDHKEHFKEHKGHLIIWKLSNKCDWMNTNAGPSAGFWKVGCG